MTESQIEEHLVAYAQSKGCMVEKLVMLGKRGWPDRTIIGPYGNVGFVEVKRPGGRLSAQQIKVMEALNLRGAFAYAADSVEEVEQIVDAICRAGRVRKYGGVL